MPYNYSENLRIENMKTVVLFGVKLGSWKAAAYAHV